MYLLKCLHVLPNSTSYACIKYVCVCDLPAATISLYMYVPHSFEPLPYRAPYVFLKGPQHWPKWCIAWYKHVHTYIHTYIHTCIHTYIHTYIHTCIHTYYFSISIIDIPHVPLCMTSYTKSTVSDNSNHSLSLSLWVSSPNILFMFSIYRALCIYYMVMSVVMWQCFSSIAQTLLSFSITQRMFHQVMMYKWYSFQ